MKIKILDRYIAVKVVIFILLVAFALLGLDLVFTLVQEINSIGKGSYSFATLMLVVVLQLPTKIYLMFPWSGLIGSLLALGLLAKHSELIVMQVSSVSVMRVAVAVVKAALIVTLIAIIIGEVVAPITDKLAHRIRSTAVSNGEAVGTIYGNWFRVANDFVQVAAIKPDNSLQNITIYQFNTKRKLQSIVYAKTATQLKTKSWQLNNLKIIALRGDKIEQRTEQILQLPELIDVALLREVEVKHLDRLSFVSLQRAITYRKQHNLQLIDYRLAFWSKIVKPAAILIMILLAVPFVFGPLRSTTIGVKVLVGILVGFSFHTLNAIFAPIAVVYSIPPYLAVSFPILLFAVLGVYLLRNATQG